VHARYMYITPEGMYSESRDLYGFWEVSDNTSVTVQDRNIVAMENCWTVE